MTHQVQNDDGEFEAFFQQGLGVALRLVSRIVPNRPEAEDVVAEAFARAYADWGRLQGLEHRTAWVMRVATNLALDAVRPRRRRLLTGDIHASEPAQGQGAVGDEFVLRTALVAALRGLPRRQREAVALRYLADFSVGEVAQALQMEPVTVRTHLRRGLHRLRSVIGQDWLEEEVAYGSEQ